jgi:O-antigen/teichoic acid export membrane protein
MSSANLVARNAFILLLSQVTTTLLSFVAVPLLTRSLGTTDYGTYWLAFSVASFAALLVEWGQDTFLPLIIAQQSGRARELLGTSLTLRLLFAIGLALPLEGAMRLLDYPAQTRAVALLLYLAVFLNSVSNGAMAAVRGLERMGWPAVTRVAVEALYTGALVVAIWMGARLKGIAAVTVLVYLLGVGISVRALISVGIMPRRFGLSGARGLLGGGAPFVLFGGILALQPSLEAVLLSKFGSQEALGWFGASAKLLSVLLFPAFILGGALAPTLARLQATDPDAFRRAVREALRISLLLAAPVAVGTYVFAAQGVALVFGVHGGYEPTADNVRVLSVYVLPVCIDIALGTVILVCGRRVAWALSKVAMLALGMAASVFLIPFWQARTGNGGLGAAAVTAGTEFGMLAFALALLPRGLIDSSVVPHLLRAVVAAATMPAAAYLLRDTPFGVQLVVSLAAYVLALAGIGGIGARDLSVLRDALRAKIAVPSRSRQMDVTD